MIWLLLTWLFSPLLWLYAGLPSKKHGRVLVIQTAKIGDFVCTTPVFRALREELPNTEIVALLHTVTVPLAKQLDSIDRVISLPKHGFKGWAGKLWLLKLLSEGYDGVLILSPNLTNLLLPFWAGIAKRASVLPDRQQGISRLAWPFLTHGEQHQTGQMFRETAVRALSGLGIVMNENILSLPNEVRGSASGRARLDAMGLEQLPRPLLGLGIGAGNRMKALEQPQLASLAAELIGQIDGTLVLIGTEVDQVTASSLVQTLPLDRVVDTTGQWVLDELPILLGALDCFIGVDSGATYMADALGIPVVDFMGPADADDQRPIGKKAVVIRSSEPCAPCSHSFDAPYHCRLGTRICIFGSIPLHKMVQEADQACGVIN